LAKTQYIQEKRFSAENQALIDQLVKIVEQYQEEGYRMTLRQLYYQLVANAIIENKQSNYSKLSGLLTDARMTGLIDWEFIEDRIRVPKFPNEFTGIPELMEVALAAYRRKRWETQANYVEVWVEKDALSGVLAPITDDFHVRLLVNRGYSSATAMHDAALRFRHHGRKHECTLLYLGDHDPSGQDMVRDIRDRLETFGAEVTVEKIALTMEQIRQYRPPPNPAKVTDPRAAEYIAKYGNQSWELDALPPNVLSKILKLALNGLIDKMEYNRIKELEEEEKSKLKAFSEREFGEEEDES
jgi:hypothetical protein